MSLEPKEQPQDGLLTLKIVLPSPRKGEVTVYAPLDATYDDVLRMLAKKYSFRAEEYYLWSAPLISMSARILPPGASRDEWEQPQLEVRARSTRWSFDDLNSPPPRRPAPLYGCPTAVHPQADRLAACRVEAIEL